MADIPLDRELELLRKIEALVIERERLTVAITLTIEENLHLADGDNCALRHLTALNIHKRSGE